MFLSTRNHWQITDLITCLATQIRSQNAVTNCDTPNFSLRSKELIAIKHFVIACYNIFLFAYHFVKQSSIHFPQNNTAVSGKGEEFRYDELRNVQRPVFKASIAARERSGQRLPLPHGGAQPHLSVRRDNRLPLRSCLGAARWTWGTEQCLWMFWRQTVTSRPGVLPWAHILMFSHSGVIFPHQFSL